MDKRLYRSRTNRIIWGVCGGLAEYFNIDPAIIRVIFVILVLAWGIGIIAYIVLAIIAPLEGGVGQTPRETVKENIQDIKDTTTQLGKEVQSSLSKNGVESPTRERHHALWWLGIALIIAGLLFLIGNIFGNWWRYLWPIILILVGLLIIFGRRR